MELRFDPEKPKYEYVTTMKHAEEVIKKLSSEKSLGVDIESTGLDPYTSNLVTVQIGTPEISYVFDARKIKFRELPGYKDLLENKGIIKILHNAKFDYGHIKYHTGAEIRNIYDTMLTEGILKAGLVARMASLQSLSEEYLNLHLEKDIRETFASITKSSKLSDEQLKYAALDTLVMFPIFEKQAVELKKEDLVKIAKLEFSATRVVSEMELRGIYLNVKRWREIIAGLEEKRDEYRDSFYAAIKPYFNQTQIDIFGNDAPPMNMNSQVQLMDLFNNKLKLNLPSTGDAVLSMCNHPVAKILRDYRGYEKLISAFGESLLEKVNKKTGRLHPDFNQLGAATGRFACSNPNLQQIPRNSEEAPFRECFNPAPGYKLVTADYSSFEMRVLAELSGDEKMIKAFKDDLDMHSFTASMMFNKKYSPDFRSKYPQLRQAAKAIGFGLMYGMSPIGLAKQIDVDDNTAKEYMDKYFQSFPSIKRFLDSLATNAIKKGWSMTPAGRKRWYRLPEKTDPDYRRRLGNIQRQAKNHPIQGTNADVIKYALVFCHERMQKEGVDGGLTHTVHDEIVCEIREDQAEDWALIQSEEMVRAGELFINKVPVISEPFVGDVWEH